MEQQNLKTKTKREVRRRPRFVVAVALKVESVSNASVLHTGHCAAFCSQTIASSLLNLLQVARKAFNNVGHEW